MAKTDEYSEPLGQQLFSTEPQTASKPQPASPAQVKPNRKRLVADRRRFQRVALPLSGRFMRSDKQEFACQMLNISPGGIALAADTRGEVGERIVVYIDDLGRFEGELTRVFEGGFAITLCGTAYKREKIANQLTWLVNRDGLDLAEDRAHERIVPIKEHVKLVLADGTEHEARLLDVSLGGASVSVLPKPDVGELVVIGLIRGTVVRHHDQGIGIRFQEIQDPATIERHFN